MKSLQTLVRPPFLHRFVVFFSWTKMLLAVVLAFAVAASCNKLLHTHDPYESTFLYRDSAKHAEQIRSTQVLANVNKDSYHQGSLSMSVYPPVLPDGADAEIFFNNVPNPTHDDFIAVTCGPTTGPGILASQSWFLFMIGVQISTLTV
jgi:hypothetical protein